MENHKEVIRLRDEHNRVLLEVDYCTDSNNAVIRCKNWLHLDKDELKDLIVHLQHMIDCSMEKKRD